MVTTMAQINVRVDENVKNSAEKVLDDIGISMSSAINVFLKKVSRERRIPFELDSDPFYSEENMRYLEGVIRDIETGASKLEEHDLIESD